jgi:hypothetical protein
MGKKIESIWHVSEPVYGESHIERPRAYRQEIKNIDKKWYQFWKSKTVIITIWI